MATLIWTDGKPYDVPDDKIQQAMADGFKPADPARLAAREQPLQAAGEGVFRGATMGFLEPLATTVEANFTGRTEAAVSQDKRLRKEENPWASGGGEVVGALGTSLATGGGASALVGGGIKGAAFEGGLYGMGSMVSESALENRELTSDRLAAGLVGGSLASGGVALTFKGLGKGVSVVTSKFGGKGIKDTLGAIADGTEWQAITKNMPEGWVKRNEPFKADILKSARKSGATGRLTAAFDDDGLSRALEQKEASGKVIGDQLKEVESFVPLTGNKALREETADFVDSQLRKRFGNSPAYDDALKDVSKYVDSIRKVDRSWSSLWDDIQSTLFKDADPTKTAVGEVREEVRQSLRNFLFDEIATGKNKAGKILSGFEPRSAIRESLPAPSIADRTIRLGDDPVVGGLQMTESTAPTIVEGAHPALKGTQFLEPDVGAVPLGRDIPGALGRTRGSVAVEGATSQPGGVFMFPGSRQVTTALPKGASPRLDMRPGAGDIAAHTVRLGDEGTSVAGGLVLDVPEVKTPAWLGAQMRQAGREYAADSAVVSAFEKRVRHLNKSGTFGVDALGAMGVGAFASGNPLGAVAAAVAKRQFERRGGLMTGAALRAIAESRVTSGISRGLEGHLGKILAVAPEVLGAYRYPLSIAAAKGADALLEEHVRLASSEEGQNYLATVALPVESPEEVEAAGGRLAVLDALEDSTREHQDQLDGAIDAMFGSASGRKASFAPVMSLKQFKVTSDSLAEIVRDPVKAFEAVPAEIQAGAPATAAEAAAKLVQMAQFLNSKMPKDPNAGMPPGLAPAWEPSAAAIDKFNRYREAVESPARVLKNMAAGYISPEQVEALKAVYPAMYADLQQKIGERLMMHKRPLSYQQRLAMSAIVGPLALGQTQAQMQVLQQSQQQLAAGADQAGGGMKKPDGRQDVNVEDSMDTQATRLERR